MARLFTGDYSTGDFSQWEIISNKSVVEGSPGDRYNQGWRHPAKGVYSAQVISEDKDCGHVARFELRAGDIPYFGGGERSEVSGREATLAPVGSTRWYALSVKFDPTFPTNHRVLDSGIVTQWHDHGAAETLGTSLASPLLALGWPFPAFAGFADDKWSLRYSVVNESYVVTNSVPLFEFPYDLGHFHDIKLQVKWAYDNTGFVRLWWNGERQTLYGGVDTFYGPNVPFPATGVVVQQGYYRNHDDFTGIVTHGGFRIADTEDSL